MACNGLDGQRATGRCFGGEGVRVAHQAFAATHDGPVSQCSFGRSSAVDAGQVAAEDSDMGAITLGERSVVMPVPARMPWRRVVCNVQQGCQLIEGVFAGNVEDGDAKQPREPDGQACTAGAAGDLVKFLCAIGCVAEDEPDGLIHFSAEDLEDVPAMERLMLLGYSAPGWVYGTCEGDGLADPRQAVQCRVVTVESRLR